MRSGRSIFRLGAAVLAAASLSFDSRIAQAVPPRVTTIAPAPLEWIVDGTGLDEVTLTFDTDVTMPAGAVTVRTLSLGTLTGVDIDPVDTLTSGVTVTFPSVRDDVLTLVVDDTVVNRQGEALDGEVAAPDDPILPSGDGIQGGPAVFTFTILQGDVNRDGVVDSIDRGILQEAALGEYNPDADLNHDGANDAADDALILGNFRQSLPQTDGLPPTVNAVTALDDVVVTFSERLDPATITRNSVYVIGADGALINATADPATGDDVRFAFPFDNLFCEPGYTVNVVNAVADASGELLRPQPPRSFTGSDTEPPTLTCLELAFSNSTEPFSIPAADIPAVPELLDFLRGTVATDDCTAVQDIRIDSSPDFTTQDLPLGINLVVFTATDDMGNSDTCESVLIVVPAVPLEGEQGPQGPQGPAGSPGAPGLPGGSGSDGVACWDLNENGLRDDDEDRNGDGLVNVFDCLGAPGEPGTDGEAGPQGEPGAEGAAGPEGSTGPAGPAGPQGEPGQNLPDEQPSQPLPDGASAPRPCGGFCGALGMLNLLTMFLGLSVLRASVRRRI